MSATIATPNRPAGAGSSPSSCSWPEPGWDDILFAYATLPIFIVSALVGFVVCAAVDGFAKGWRDGRLNRRNKMKKSKNQTVGQPQVGCDAVFSPLAVCRESMHPGELYLWKRNNTVEVVKLNEPEDGILVMSDDFPDYEEWYFADELIGSLFGPVRLGENGQSAGTAD
jgi:hypothetical protein